ncbi:MAG: O-antigen ligase family protein [Bacteroidia bacterium]
MRFQLSEKVHHSLYYAGLIFCAVGMPLSKPIISIGLMLVFGNWIWEGRFAEKMRLLQARKVIWVLLGFFVLHLLGMLWTEAPAVGWRDIRIKLPLFFLPLLIGTSPPLSRKAFDWLIGLFMAAVFASTAITFLLATHIIPHTPAITDARAASVFVPLIRLSLMTVLCVFWIGRYLFQEIPVRIKFGLGIFAVWFIFFLVYMQSLTGLVVLVTGGFILLVVLSIVHTRKKIAWALLGLFIISALIIGKQIKTQYDLFYNTASVDWDHLEQKTKRGNSYTYDRTYPMLENGNLVLIYVCEEELREGWNQRSAINFDTGKNTRGNLISHASIRYLASKGLRKDAEGLAQLTAADIKAIEEGSTNANEPNMSRIDRRLYQVFWEAYHYEIGGNPSGNSVTMRLDLGKNAYAMVKEKIWLGYGTGASEFAYRTHYEKHGTGLDKEWQWLHPHNQFLSVALTLGVPALLFFLFSLIYPAMFANRWRNFMYLSFFLVAVLSFFDDDTLETQQGATFYAFFNAVLLFAMMPGSLKREAAENQSL